MKTNKKRKPGLNRDGRNRAETRSLYQNQSGDVPKTDIRFCFSFATCRISITYKLAYFQRRIDGPIKTQV